MATTTCANCKADVRQPHMYFFEKRLTCTARCAFILAFESAELKSYPGLLNQEFYHQLIKEHLASRAKAEHKRK